MSTLHKILIPIDFTAATKNAVQYANNMFERHPAEVVLVYVNCPEKKVKEQEIRDSFKAFEVDNLKKTSFFYQFEVVNGNLLQELANASLKHGADMVIMGTEERVPDIELAHELIRMHRDSSVLKIAE